MRFAKAFYKMIPSAKTHILAHPKINTTQLKTGTVKIASSK